MSLEGYDVDRGVYRSEVVIDGVKYRAMSNVGVRPSVGGKELLLETHVIDYSGDLYGRVLRVCLVEKLRDEKRFASIGDLKEQLMRDYNMIRR
jgi:riboflavin kinase/FMN adenylyltransferase